MVEAEPGDAAELFGLIGLYSALPSVGSNGVQPRPPWHGAKGRDLRGHRWAQSVLPASLWQPGLNR